MGGGPRQPERGRGEGGGADRDVPEHARACAHHRMKVEPDGGATARDAAAIFGRARSSVRTESDPTMALLEDQTGSGRSRAIGGWCLGALVSGLLKPPMGGVDGCMVCG